MKHRLILSVALTLLAGCASLPGAPEPGTSAVPADVQDTPVAAPTQDLSDATTPVVGDLDVAETADVDAGAETDIAPEVDVSGDEDSTPEAGETGAAEPEPEAPDANAAARERCSRQNGKFTRTKAGAFVCVNYTGDNGRVCTASGQCEGACLARSGTCSPVTPLVGCNEILTDNGSRATVCID